MSGQVRLVVVTAISAALIVVGLFRIVLAS
jgi:hypothetical protein